MSTLNANTFTGTTSAGSIVVTGEGGSTTTNLQQGLTKAWVNYTGISTTAARDSFNVGSLTDLATGRTQVNFTNNMNNDDYSGHYYSSASTGTSFNNFSNDYAGGFGGFATSNCSAVSYSSTDIDSFQNVLGVVGDLA